MLPCGHPRVADGEITGTVPQLSCSANPEHVRDLYGKWTRVWPLSTDTSRPGRSRSGDAAAAGSKAGTTSGAGGPSSDAGAASAASAPPRRGIWPFRARASPRPARPADPLASVARHGAAVASLPLCAPLEVTLRDAPGTRRDGDFSDRWLCLGDEHWDAAGRGDAWARPRAVGIVAGGVPQAAGKPDGKVSAVLVWRNPETLQMTSTTMALPSLPFTLLGASAICMTSAPREAGVLPPSPVGLWAGVRAVDVVSRRRRSAPRLSRPMAAATVSASVSVRGDASEDAGSSSWQSDGLEGARGAADAFLAEGFPPPGMRAGATSSASVPAAGEESLAASYAAAVAEDGELSPEVREAARAAAGAPSVLFDPMSAVRAAARNGPDAGAAAIQALLSLAGADDDDNDGFGGSAAGRPSAAAAMAEPLMIVGGDVNGGGRGRNSYMLGRGASSWHLGPMLCNGRGYAQSAWCSTHAVAIVAGGMGKEAEGVLAGGERLDTRTGAWAPLASASPCPRAKCAFAWDEPSMRLYRFGGIGGGVEDAQNSFDFFDLVAGKWSDPIHMKLAKPQHLGAAVIDSDARLAFISGGVHGHVRSSLSVVDLRSLAVMTQRLPAMEAHRCNHIMVLV
ncbi:hypothetical protein FNF27_05641 [Cafeteria roenbergensis]|uniref:Uncharacterized protein n=2 Tax=Cafeteria roenbergensis TaxID=33653 RepID=A0A5A8E586_CAFRO|nr:hypothetical protein FNF29_04816 [Cafeteria roenbergensis]KAA0172886.1 hypothetical protein FNF27_05641 [Cafeteria roenbergensis]|eukprot:KAA0151125.1 hypothetical protein FNF29_04816 [Cafeteria roenbergensis]